nr:hypothetical protein [Armatimonadota bacterium]
MNEIDKTNSPTAAVTEPAPNKALVAGSDGNAALRVGDRGPRHPRRTNPAREFAAAFLPNRAVSPMTM